MIWYLMTGVVAYLSVPLLLPIFQKQAKTNYLGEMVPTSLGYAFVLPSALMLIPHFNSHIYGSTFTVLVLIFSIFGGIDDCLGDAAIKGFQGHFRQGRLSTGGLKALGGFFASLAGGSLLTRSWLELILNGAIIALGANLLNLLDLRPGRAGKFFLLLGLPLFLLSRSALLPFGVLLSAVAGYLPWDLRRLAMMGDAGSNALGAALGLAVVLIAKGPWKWILAFLLLSLNVLSEKVSFSKIIEANPVLKFIDHLGR